MNELEHPTGDPYGAKDGKDLISGIAVFPMEPHVPRKADIDQRLQFALSARLQRCLVCHP